MATEIDQLLVSIETESKDKNGGLDGLAASLERLMNSSSKLNTLTKRLQNLRDTVNSFESGKMTALSQFMNALQDLAQREVRLPSLTEFINDVSRLSEAGIPQFAGELRELGSALGEIRAQSEGLDLSALSSLTQRGQKSIRTSDPDGEGPEVARENQVLQNPLEDATPDIQGDTVADMVSDGLKEIIETAEQAGAKVKEVFDPLREQAKSIRGELQGLVETKQDLVKAGFGLGDEQFESILREIKEKRVWLKNYEKSLYTTSAESEKAPEQEPTDAIRPQEVAALESVGKGTSAARGKVLALRQELSGLTSQLKQMKQNGMGPGDESYDNIYVRIKEVQGAIKDYQKSLTNAAKARESTEQTASAFQRLKKAAQAARQAMSGFGNVLGGARNVASGIGSVFSSFLHPIRSASNLLGRFQGLLHGTGGAARTANQSFSLFGNGIMKSVGRILTYRMIRSVLSGITSGISTGITNLYHANSQFAASLDQCATSAQYLKNSLAAALSPAINAMAPVIDYVVDRVVDFINVINMLIAIMTGSSTWTKAVKTPAKFGGALDDAASSAGGANEAAQELQRTLMGFDEINKLNELSSGGGGGGSSGTSGTDYSSMFTTQQVSTEALGGKLADIWSVFQDAWESEGQKVMDAAQNAMETLKTTAADIGTAFYNVWTDGTGQSYIESLLERFRSLMDVVNALAATFDEAWTEAGRGEGVIRAVFDRMTEVNGLITDIRDTFTNVWSNGTGKEIWGALLDIITDCNNIVTGLTSGIREAWNEAGRGEGIWQAILSPVNTILSYLRNITSATASWAAELDFEPLLESVKRLLGAIDPIIDTIGGVLEDIWNNFVLPLGQWLIESGLPGFLDGVAAALTTIGDIASKVVSSIKLLVDYIGGIELDWDALWSDEDVLTLPDIDLEAELSAVWAPDAEEKIDKLNDLDGKTLNAKVNDTLKNAPRTLRNRLVTGFGTPSVSVNNTLKNAPQTLRNSLVTGFGTPNVSVNDTLKNAPRTLRNSLVTGFGTPNVSVNNTLKNSASTLWSGWKSKWGSRQVSIGNVLATSASSLWNSWKKNWNPSPLAFTARMGTDVAKFASTTASSINSQLSKSKNKIKPQFASVKYSVSSTNLSSKNPVTIRPTFMARGGIIDRATLFGGNVIGEDGAEAVIPLEHHTQWLDKVADRLARKLSSGGSEEAVIIENHLYLDGDQIYEGVYRDIDRRTRRNGKLPFAV